jgi:hypothetical protein
MAGTLTIGTLSDGTNSTSATDAIKGSAKAWVNFNGVTTVSIRASYNVSSVVRNAVGDYTINLTTALADANYVVAIATGLASNATGADIGNATAMTAPTSSVLRIGTRNSSTGANMDMTYAHVSFFR